MKFSGAAVLGFILLVAPFTGAWIEISMNASAGIENAASHPSRVRGLK